MAPRTPEGSWPFSCRSEQPTTTGISAAARSSRQPDPDRRPLRHKSGTRHPAAGRAASLYVVAGQTRLDHGTGQPLRVAQVVVHPNYVARHLRRRRCPPRAEGSATTAPAIAIADDAEEASAVNGNAWEWTAGWARQTPQRAEHRTTTAPLGPTSCRTPPCTPTPPTPATPTTAEHDLHRLEALRRPRGRHLLQRRLRRPARRPDRGRQWRQIGITSFTLLTPNRPAPLEPAPEATAASSGSRRRFAWIVAAPPGDPQAAAGAVARLRAPGWRLHRPRRDAEGPARPGHVAPSDHLHRVDDSRASSRDHRIRRARGWSPAAPPPSAPPSAPPTRSG